MQVEGGPKRRGLGRSPSGLGSEVAGPRTLNPETRRSQNQIESPTSQPCPQRCITEGSGVRDVRPPKNLDKDPEQHSCYKA